MGLLREGRQRGAGEGHGRQAGADGVLHRDDRGARQEDVLRL